jgi:hypothetical protein
MGIDDWQMILLRKSNNTVAQKTIPIFCHFGKTDLE